MTFYRIKITGPNITNVFRFLTRASNKNIIGEIKTIKSLNTGGNRDPRYRYGASIITRRDKYSLQ